jgi:ABC-type antimicrobial peptide transport system permease subunit
MALGASTGGVVRLVLKQSLGLAGIGILAGLGLALLASRLISSVLYGIPSFDMATFLVAPILLLAVVVLASCSPAVRATRISAVDALRSE